MDKAAVDVAENTTNMMYQVKRENMRFISSFIFHEVCLFALKFY